MGVFLGIIIGSSFSLSFILTVMHIRKAVSKRKSAEEERFRILEKQLSVVAEKCDRTHKACCLLSDVVKENYKTEEKEVHETSKIPWSEVVRNMPLMQNCSIEDSVLRNMELMQNCCSVSTEEAQKRLFHALYPGWRLPDDPD